MATTQDLVVKRGSLWDGLTVQFLVSGTPVNLTGAYILCQIKKEACSDDYEKQFSTTDGTIVIDNPATGTFSIEPTTIDLPPRLYWYDIYVESTGRKDYLIDPSRFEVTGNVSRQ